MDDFFLLDGWEGAPERIDKFIESVRAKMVQALEAVAVFLVGKIKEGIVEQAPGGQAFTPLHPFTVAQRLGLDSMEGVDATGQKRLIHHGDLLQSISQAVDPDELVAVVGVNRKATTTSDDGEEQLVANIALILTEGRIVTVTDKMRAWLHAHGLHLKPDTTHIVIPPSPFIEPTWRKYKGEAIQLLRTYLGME